MTGTGADSTMAASSAATAKAWKRARMGSPRRSATDRSAMSMAAAPSVICDELPAVMSGAVSGSKDCAGGSDGQALQGGVPADALVGARATCAGEGALVVTDGHGDGLAGEVARVGGRRGTPMALQRVLVHVLAGDLPLVGQHLGHPELHPQPAVDDLEERLRERARAAPGVRGQRAPGSSTPPRRRWRGRSARPPPRRRRSARPAGTSRTGGPRWWPAPTAGSPAATQALRATLVDCSPTWVTHPPMTSSMRSGSTPGAGHEVRQREAPAGRRGATWPAPRRACRTRAARVDDDRLARRAIGQRTTGGDAAGASAAVYDTVVWRVVVLMGHPASVGAQPRHGLWQSAFTGGESRTLTVVTS